MDPGWRAKARVRAKRWRLAHKDRIQAYRVATMDQYRVYMREYMRRYRSALKAKSSMKEPSGPMEPPPAAGS